MEGLLKGGHGVVDNEKKIKVLEICGGAFGKGGGSTMVWNWYRNFDLDRINVDFYCFSKPDIAYIDVVRKNGGSCFVMKPSDNRYRRKVNEIIELTKIVKEQRYDFVHVHQDGAFAHLLIYWVTKKYVDRFIVHAHSTSMGSDPVKERLHRTLRPFLKGDKMICLACSKDAAEWQFPTSVIADKRYTVIKNGIDIEKFVFNSGTRHVVRKQLGLEKNFAVGHVGRLAYAKNHEFLINTFAEVKKSCPDAVLLLIGGESGENMGDKLKEQVCSLGLAESVIFYGNTDRVNELYQAMDCFVFPSRYEGLGIVAIEAQAAGLKTLCSDSVPEEAKITELLEYMPLAAGAEKWAEKILTYNDGYERKNMAQQIREAGYDIKMSAKQVEDIYLSLHNENGGG